VGIGVAVTGCRSLSGFLKDSGLFGKLATGHCQLAIANATATLVLK
jgi:hypothetical protein